MRDRAAAASSQPRSKRAKQLSGWQQEAVDLLDTILQEEHAVFFAEEVDLDAFPDYLDYVASPMDFGTIRKALYRGDYKDAAGFLSDMRLVFQNAYTYNALNSECVFRILG